jgi:exodeoxyribonuclease-3
MRLASWNVNGFRAIIKKNFWEWLRERDYDVVCLQETKCRRDQLAEADAEPAGYHAVWNGATVKKGYSGVVCFSKTEPLQVRLGLPETGNNHDFAGEGRLITLEYEDFFLTNCYYPNSGMGPHRLEFKLGYNAAYLAYVQELRRAKPVVATGDFNCAHHEIDLKNPERNRETPGFLPEERAWVDAFVAAGFVDTFRMFEPEGGHYTWWSYLRKARERNAGWRIDYFFVSEELQDRVRAAWIEADVMGSDHCPVGLELEI